MEKLLKITLTALWISASIAFCKAEEPKPSVWEIKFSKSVVKPNDTVTMYLIGSIPNKQAVYATNFKCEGGPLPTQIKFLNAESGYIVKDSIKSVGEKREYDEIFECDFTKFKDKAIIKQVLIFKEKEPLIKVYLEYQTCTDQLCMMYSNRFEIKGTKVIEMKN